MVLLEKAASLIRLLEEVGVDAMSGVVVLRVKLLPTRALGGF